MRKLIWVPLALVVLQDLFGIAGFVLGDRFPIEGRPPSLFPHALNLTYIGVFGSVGLWLIFAGRRDRRAVHLGSVCLLLTGPFSIRLILRLSEIDSPLIARAVSLLTELSPEAFLPFFLWLFFADFPHTPSFGIQRTVARWGIWISLVACLILFVVTSWPDLAFDKFAVSIPLILPALAFSVWKARTARLEEKRRVRLFVAGFLLALAPVTLAFLLEGLVPALARILEDPVARRREGIVLHSFLLTLPLTMAYSVLVDHVLDVKLVVRRAVQYALARYSVLLATAVPFVGLLWYLQRHRGETLEQILSGSGALVLAGATLLGLSAVRLRHPMLEFMDRRFFREQYDSRKILARLVDRSRSTRSTEDLAALLSAEIDRALHLHSISVLVADPVSAGFASPDGSTRPLEDSAELIRVLSGGVEPLDVRLDDARSPLRRLAADEREWLADGAIQLLVPLVGSKGSLVGMIALGEKRSELAYSREDRLLLTAIAESAALTLENRMMRDSYPEHEITPVRAGPAGRVAAECGTCGVVQPESESACTRCKGPVKPAVVPLVLLNKFRFERRVGAGGMGIVYRARDLDLGRTVAIKTLPRVAPEYSLQLRREARTMASVSHANLALIYGAETWRGIPMLICEFLDGGTLADRLRSPLPPDEAFDLVITLAEAVDKTHAAGILHRDIKPSNIGYTADGVPKLLDFGLAKIVDDTRSEGAVITAADASDATQTVSIEAGLRLSVEGRIVGTPLYLSPETAQGRPADALVDLWALSVVLFEALTGKSPVRDATLEKTLDRIRKADTTAIQSLWADCPPPVTRLFEDLLAGDVRRRPSNARRFKARLEAVRSGLSAGAAPLPG